MSSKIQIFVKIQFFIRNPISKFWFLIKKMPLGSLRQFFKITKISNRASRWCGGNGAGIRSTFGDDNGPENWGVVRFVWKWKIRKTNSIYSRHFNTYTNIATSHSLQVNENYSIERIVRSSSRRTPTMFYDFVLGKNRNFR